VRDETSFAQRFDLQRLRLEGEPVVVAQDVRFDPRFTSGAFSVSQRGLIVYQAAANQDAAELVWLDRRGQRLGRLDGPGHFGAVSISPQGDQVVLSVFDSRTWRGHPRVYDLAHGSSPSRPTLGARAAAVRRGRRAGPDEPVGRRPLPAGLVQSQRGARDRTVADR
jgi:hypothetical protein